MEQKLKQDISIGHNIRRLRINACLTQEELTAKMQLAECQISRSTLAKIESGICNIRISELKVMKNIFNASWDDLFFDI